MEQKSNYNNKSNKSNLNWFRVFVNKQMVWMLLLLFWKKQKQNAEHQHVTGASSQSSLTFVSGSPSVACSTVCLRSSMVSSSMLLSTWSFSTSPRSTVPPASSSWFGGGEGKTGEGVERRGGERRSRRWTKRRGERVRDNDKAAACHWPTPETCFISTSHTLNKQQNVEIHKCKNGRVPV